MLPTTEWTTEVTHFNRSMSLYIITGKFSVYNVKGTEIDQLITCGVFTPCSHVIVTATYHPILLVVYKEDYFYFAMCLLTTITVLV